MTKAMFHYRVVIYDSKPEERDLLYQWLRDNVDERTWAIRYFGVFTLMFIHECDAALFRLRVPARFRPELYCGVPVDCLSGL